VADEKTLRDPAHQRRGRPRLDRPIDLYDRTAPPPAVAERVELLGLGVIVTVLERLDTDECRRALAYVNDRFGETR